MTFNTTIVFEKNAAAYRDKKRLIVNSGGTSSSKTYSIIQLLVFIALHAKTKLLISIVSESVPHIRRGAYRDFMSILGSDYDVDRMNKTLFLYDFGTAQIEFFSADDASKLRGGRRDILFINEVNNIPREAFDELDVRTRLCTFVDFNPVSEFYIHEMQGLPQVEWISSTYLDAQQVVPQTVIDNILSRKDRDPNWWNVYGLGLLGKIEGLCHPFFSQCDILPEKYDLQVYGLDFGYSIDPTALVQTRIVGDAIYSRELIYEKGLTNDQIAKRFENWGIRKGQDIIIADSAEPKSIEEIRRWGYDVRPSTKGPDSANNGIQRVNQYKQYWTKDSLDCIKEQRNYRWEKNPEGKFTNKPIGDWDHGMSARRYSLSKEPEPKILDSFQLKSPVSDFRIAFLEPSEYSEFFCGIWLQEDLKTNCLLALWNAREVKLWVFYEKEFNHPRSDLVVPGLCAALRVISENKVWNLTKFRLIGNKALFGKVGEHAMNEAWSRAGFHVEQNTYWEEGGAIALASRLLQRNGLRIHNRCERVSQECSKWVINNNEPEPGYGFARCLLNLVSFSMETTRFDPQPKPMASYSREKTEFNRVVSRLAAEGKLDQVTDEQIEEMMTPGLKPGDTFTWVG